MIGSLIRSRLKKDFPGCNYVVLTLDETEKLTTTADGRRVDFKTNPAEIAQSLELLKNNTPGEWKGMRLTVDYFNKTTSLVLYYILNGKKISKTVNL